MGLVPDAWLVDTGTFAEPAAQREVYRRFLTARVQASQTFVEEAVRARSLHV